MRKLVDARGLACPGPVIEVRKALKGMSPGELEVLVDNSIAVENLQKMARQLGLEYTAETLKGDHHRVLIAVGKVSEATGAPGAESVRNSVVALASQLMGEGDPMLGQILMKGFIYALSELETAPARVVLYNSGVKLAVNGSESLGDLQKLAARGVEISSCGTCLNFYRLTDQLGVGRISNMYDIARILLGAEAIIRP